MATPATKRLLSQSVKALAAKMAAGNRDSELAGFVVHKDSPARIRGGKGETSIALGLGTINALQKSKGPAKRTGPFRGGVVRVQLLGGS